ncbi:MAG TPA: RsmB/NOP family class I SAM-dependent RNA methyltransferase [Anaeromyxobacteraceae bacterium]|nr:RsmB/NOP family class I SAM-dependent RNA methyltransferase [Anaeromyxobacteraceae bacterium]
MGGGAAVAPFPARSVERLRGLPWEGLQGLAPALDGPLGAVLGGAAAERELDRFLRSRPDLGAAGRRAAAEAVFGVGLWRRRLRHHAGEEAPPRLLLAALLRDLSGRDDAEVLCGLAPGSLPPPAAPPGDLAGFHSLPGWLDAALRRAAGDEAPLLADALNLPGPVFLRANRARTDRDALAARLLGEGIETRPTRLAPDGLEVLTPRPNLLALPALRDGLLEVQDEGSQLLGLALGALPGESVLDACAGAGGKALLLAAAVGPSGTVHACDPDGSRLERLRTRARRAGAAVTVHGAEAPAGLLVDRVLVDAPCSELGALRRGPDLRFRIDPAGFAALPRLQLGILRRAALHVRPGGRLVYATCTFRPEEGEEVARAFAAEHPAFEPVDALPGLSDPDGILRLLPHRHGTDGFTAAAWTRRG